MKSTGKYNLSAGRFAGMNMIIMLAAAFTFSLQGCGEKKEAPKAPEGMHTLDLSRYGKPFSIFVPDTIKLKMQITEQSSGALDIKVGSNFAISINEQAADIELRKTDIKDDEVYKLKSFVVDEPTGIIWESAIPDPEGKDRPGEFHFLMNQKVGASDYSFEDIRDPQVNPFGKEAIQKMYDQCKNIVPAEKKNS
jgi:hypothetical protein